MASLSFVMVFIFPIVVLGLVAWLLEKYWQRRAPFIEATYQEEVLKKKALKAASLKSKTEKKQKGIKQAALKQPELLGKELLGKAQKGKAPKKLVSDSDEMPVAHIKIIFAGLDGTEGAIQTEQIRAALEREFVSGTEQLPLTLINSPKAIGLDEGGRIKVIQEGQALLKQYDADILIWGQLFSSDTTGYSLSFLKNETKGKDIFTRLLCGIETIRLKRGELSRFDALAVVTLAMAHAFEICDMDVKKRVLAVTSLRPRLAEAVVLDDDPEHAFLTKREWLWAYAWWLSVIALQEDHKAKMVEASLLWVKLLKNWPKEDSSYEAASERNNLAVICYFLAQKTRDLVWFDRSHQQALKAQAYFRKTGYHRRWSELEFLVLSASSVLAIEDKDKDLISKNQAAFLDLQKEWTYQDHSNFWMRIDVELDKLRASLPSPTPS